MKYIRHVFYNNNLTYEVIEMCQLVTKPIATWYLNFFHLSFL